MRIHSIKDVDTVIIRENTEGEYCGVEHEVINLGDGKGMEMIDK